MKQGLFCVLCVLFAVGVVGSMLLMRSAATGTAVGCPANTGDAVLAHMSRCCNSYGEPNLENTRRAIVNIQKVRAWAGTLQDRCVRSSYLEWCDYLEEYASRRLARAARESEVPAPPMELQ